MRGLPLLFGLAVGGLLGYLASRPSHTDRQAFVAVQKILEASPQGRQRILAGEPQGAPSPWGCSGTGLSDQDKQDLSATLTTSIIEGLRQELSVLERRPIGEASSRLAEDPEIIERAVAQSDEILSRAMDAGVWSKDDKEHFEATLSQMPGDLAFEARRQLAVAINAGEIEPAKGTLF